MSEERRCDPTDGVAYTFAELASFYKGTYTKGAIKEYWEQSCIPMKTKTAASKANAKVKAKAKAKAKFRVKAQDADGKDPGAAGLCVAGEALIDFLPATLAEGGSAYRGVPGGSPFNCCIAAQRLGIPVSFLGVLSTDLFGEELYGHLAREGVDMEFVARAGKPSTLAFVSRSKGEGEKYAFFKENSADRSLDKRFVTKALSSRRFLGVHMSLGAVTLEHGPCAQSFRKLFQLAGTQRALRSFDPNIRSNIIKEAPAKYSERIEAFLRMVDLAKTSEEDMEFLYGKGTDVTVQAAKWLKIGPKLVVITRGAKGAEAFFQREDAAGAVPSSVTVPPPGERPSTIDAEGKSAPVVDTVGAGDTFMGGLIAGCLGVEAPGTALLPQLVERKPWDEEAAERLHAVLARAGLCAAITCSRAGADPPTAAEVAAAAERLGK
uniref:Carbohydrate kinase PfkB domain-containing protein n=1 Tax=Pyrodinium bahamense TaxID=73915 RepID=A0A7R9ZY94_9DINO|mmetsp:Transcript_1486/g.4055  ORF Transcript_1486/g.4055 Transcript_1486/m.4055 type:complete len:435 (+) Transcript_1486:73-1377(+)|eukprot:CAMPEP_0179040002 /NCGR_PEP_ID=MMETSP0796-20121207/15424_1 /TAXON_ID=73915 /ORGANISM="Pyrodinium bahamense, Strain pbaha01" /LENGTH=434 /DNA_ID=CAMNT_0020736337 /DNA_START=70 /DNA_END=1374 /DNA_ORIENTATION=-